MTARSRLTKTNREAQVSSVLFVSRVLATGICMSFWAICSPQATASAVSAPLNRSSTHKQQTSRIYAADELTGARTDRLLYEVIGERVYAVDSLTGQRTKRVLRYIIDGKVYAANGKTGARTSRVLRYIDDGWVYAADATTGSRTSVRLSYINGGKVFAVDATGQATSRILRYIVGNATTD